MLDGADLQVCIAGDASQLTALEDALNAKLQAKREVLTAFCLNFNLYGIPAYALMELPHIGHALSTIIPLIFPLLAQIQAVLKIFTVNEEFYHSS